MATAALNPQASAPQSGAAPASPEANQLQTALGKIAMLLKQIAAQNVSVQEPLNSAVNSIVQAIQMARQAQVAPPSQPAAPPQQ